MEDRFIKNFAQPLLIEEGAQILVGESDVFDQRPDGEALMAHVPIMRRG